MHPSDYTKYAAHGYPSAPMTIPAAPLFPSFAVHAPTPTPNTSRKWSTNLCHCFDDPANCLVTCICPCVTFGQIAEIITQGKTTCLAGGGIYCVLLGVTGLACLYSCFYRSRMRGQYELEQAPCDDCVLHLCCETCALCQEYRELKNRGFDMGIGYQANVNRHGQRTTVAPFQGTMTR